MKSGYYKHSLGYDVIDRFVDEVVKLENKMTFCLENTNKDMIMTEEDAEH